MKHIRARSASSSTARVPHRPGTVDSDGLSITEGLRPYPDYKESGQRWLGRIPSGWSLLPNRALFDEVKERDCPDEEMLSVTITKGVIRQRALLSETAKKDGSNTDKAAYKLVQPGDIAYNKMRAWQGAFGASLFRGIVSPAYVVMRPRSGVLPWFYHHLYRTLSFAKEAERWSYGITSDMWSLRPEHFKLIYSIKPPVDEQVAIVRFLDHANGKIERFIRAKRKLIGLLNEQKLAIIHRAVTRGLIPNGPVKPSGIPWLGDIPVHWKRIRLKFEASHIVDCLHATPTYRIDGVHPAIRTADIEPGRVRLEQARKISPTEFHKWTERLRPEEGDILYSREGERFGIAANVPAGTPLCISQRMMVFRIRKPHNSEYVMWQLNCRHVYLQASLYVMGSTAPHVNVEQIRNFQLALPPPDEQKAIAEHIRCECRTINAAIARTEREIALMQEYRTRLTADVVTGKLDVRSAAAKLPEIAPEDFSADESPADNEELALEEADE